MFTHISSDRWCIHLLYVGVHQRHRDHSSHSGTQMVSRREATLKYVATLIYAITSTNIFNSYRKVPGL